MNRYLPLKSTGLLGVLLLGLSGCGVWPVMTEDNGRRPHAFGKSDQVLWPWAPQPKHLNEKFGVAYRQSLERQIANPGAANNFDPVPGGQDPLVIQNRMTRYQLMFEKPPFEAKKSSGSSSSSVAGGGNTK